MDIERKKKLTYLTPIRYSIIIVGSLISLLAWFAINQSENAAIDKFMTSGSTAVRDQLVEHIEGSFATLQRLAKRWEVGQGIRPNVWKADTESAIKKIDGLVEIVRLDSTLKIDRNSLDEATTSQELLIPDAILSQIESLKVEKLSKLATVWEEDGKSKFLYLVPLYINGEFHGAIAGLFHIRPFIDGIVHEQMANDFHITIKIGQQEIYSQGSQPSEELSRNFSVNFANGERWDFQVQLTGQKKSELESNIPELLLVLGFILILLIERSTRLQEKASEIAEIARQSEIATRRAQDLSEYYRSLVEHSNDAITTRDLNSIITSWNHAAELLFGYSAEEAVGQHVTIIFPDELFDEEQDIIEQIKAGEKIEAYETIRKNKTKGIVEIFLTISPIKDSYGRIIGAAAISRDITEKNIAERRLEYYRSLVEHSNDAIMTKDVNSIITSWNHAAELLFGYSAEEAIGQHLTLIYPEELFGEERFIIEQIKAGEKIEGFETIRISKAGEKIDVSLTISPVKDPSGKIIGASAICRDVRERNRAERRFRMVVTSALDAVISMDEEGRVTDWNPQAEAILGWDKDEMLGKPLADHVIPERFRDSHWKGLERFLTTGVAPILNRRIEASALLKTGEEIPVELSITPHSFGGKYEFSAFLRDISKEKKTLSELQFRTEEMEQLLYSVSHDLKSPLVTIQGFSGMLASFIASGQAKEAEDAASRIIRATRTMGNLINDLLQLGSVGKNSLVIKNVNVQDVIKEVLESNSMEIQKDSIEVVIAEQLPSVNTDRQRLYQVFQNLITNAVKYGCEPGGRIEIGYRKTRNDFCFYVKDYGDGISEEYHRKIFHIFQRLHKGGEGTGLGLAIVAKTMHLLGGHVWVESEPGKGATFWFSLPRFNRYARDGIIKGSDFESVEGTAEKTVAKPE